MRHETIKKRFPLFRYISRRTVVIVLSLTVLLSAYLFFREFQGEAVFAEGEMGFVRVRDNTGATLELVVLSLEDRDEDNVMRIAMPDGSVGIADLVDVDDINASPVRIYTPFGIRSWRQRGDGL